MQKHVNLVDLVKSFSTTPELFLERGGELRIVREDFSVYVRYCYVHLSKFSFFSFFPCPFFLIFFSKQIAIPTSIYLQKSASIQPRTSLSKFGGRFNSLFIRLLSPRPRRPRLPERPRSRTNERESTEQST